MRIEYKILSILPVISSMRGKKAYTYTAITVTATGKATAHECAIRVLHKVSWYTGRNPPLFPPAKFVSWLRPIHLDEGTPASPQQDTSLLPLAGKHTHTEGALFSDSYNRAVKISRISGHRLGIL